MAGHRNRIILALLAASFLAASFFASAAHAAPPHTPDSCKALRHTTYPASIMGLPTSGAQVDSAAHRHLGAALYCRVRGRIFSVAPHADPIRFELNLPENWNGKALQYGGGTFDGYIIRGTGSTAAGLRSQTAPLGRGYATFGSDSGHHRNYFPFPREINALNAKFARNPEEQRNFDGDALKKLHDLVVAVITRRYARPPARMYFIGGSTGGREALRVAQRFPDDYDGILAAYPAWDEIELDLQLIRTAKALYEPGGFLGHAQTKFIARTVLEACDAQDGLRDGMVSNPAGCHVDPSTLACRAGHHPHGCLSAAQLHTLETYATPQHTFMPMDPGIDSIPGYNVLSGVDLTGSTGFFHFALHHPIYFFNAFNYVMGDDVVRNFLTVGRHYDSRDFDTTNPGPYLDEVLEQARRLDATDANLTPFFAHGGKLILVHGTADPIIPTNSTVDYYQRVLHTMGAAATAASVRLYLIPGFGHGRGPFNAGFDTIGVLDAWADKGIAPAHLTVTDNDGFRRSRPLCAWPTWPRYNGSGPPDAAASFSCAEPTSLAQNSAD